MIPGGIVRRVSLALRRSGGPISPASLTTPKKSAQRPEFVPKDFRHWRRDGGLRVVTAKQRLGAVRIVRQQQSSGGGWETCERKFESRSRPLKA